MQIRTDALPWPLDSKLRQILQEELAKVKIPKGSGAILSFRDPDFTPETGGFHPVEIAIDREGSILYMTDFAYFGRPPHCDLAKELDFDFSLRLFQHFGREHPISHGRELFALWQSNFIAYCQMGAYSVAVEASR